MSDATPPRVDDQAILQALRALDPAAPAAAKPRARLPVLQPAGP